MSTHVENYNSSAWNHSLANVFGIIVSDSYPFHSNLTDSPIPEICLFENLTL